MAPSTRNSSLRVIKSEAEREVEQEKKALAVIKPRDDVAPPLTATSGIPIPTWLRFPLLVLSSLIVSAAGYSSLSALDHGAG